jgi:hypothetical protein
LMYFCGRALRFSTTTQSVNTTCRSSAVSRNPE